MLFSPAILALVSTSLLVTGFIAYASWLGVRIALLWDRGSASRAQLALEKETHLVSGILSYVMVIELGSLFLFLAVADRLHPFFQGAMCAAGTLNLNAFGHLTLAAKVATFFLCGLWLICNHLDDMAWDHPLIRFKYLFLLGLCPMLVGETLLQIQYLADLDPQLIASCCGSLFGERAAGLPGTILRLPAAAMTRSFYVVTGLTVAAGAYFLLTGRRGWLYGLLSLTVFPVSIVALISSFSVHFYGLPTHHCPFCILHRDYYFVGYFLYACLLAGAVSGTATGIVGLFRNRASLQDHVPKLQQRLCRISVAAYASFTVAVTYVLAASKLTAG